MEDEGKLWVRASRDPQTRAVLRKGYTVELYVSVVLIVAGAGLMLIPDAGWVAECILMITLGICGTIFGLIHLSRIKKMDSKTKDCEQ